MSRPTRTKSEWPPSVAPRGMGGAVRKVVGLAMKCTPSSTRR